MQWYYLTDENDQIAVDDAELGTLVRSGQLTADTQIWREDMDEWLPCSQVFPHLFAEAAPVASAAPRLIVGQEADARTPQLQTPHPEAPVLASAAVSSPVSAAPVTDESIETVKYAAAPMIQNKGWLTFAGVMLCIISALLGLGAFALTIWSILSMAVLGSSAIVLLLGSLCACTTFVLLFITGIKLCQTAGSGQQAALTGHKGLLANTVRQFCSAGKLAAIAFISYLATILLISVGTTIAIRSGFDFLMKQGESIDSPDLENPDIDFPDTPVEPDVAPDPAPEPEPDSADDTDVFG